MHICSNDESLMYSRIEADAGCGGPSQITLCILAYTGCELKMDSFGDREPGNNFHQLASQSANEGTVYL